MLHHLLGLLEHSYVQSSATCSGMEYIVSGRSTLVLIPLTVVVLGLDQPLGIGQGGQHFELRQVLIAYHLMQLLARLLQGTQAVQKVDKGIVLSLGGNIQNGLATVVLDVQYVVVTLQR